MLNSWKVKSVLEALHISSKSELLYLYVNDSSTMKNYS